MGRTANRIARLLDQLEQFHGKQAPGWPVDPYEFLVWWHCGYPASDAACAKGWERLGAEVGMLPDQLLRATPQKLSAALRAGGMVPELRAARLKEIAMRVKDQFGGDLRTPLIGPLREARKTLKSFSGIADPGADRILLFAGIAPLAAVPSNCTEVLARFLEGREAENYQASYRAAQRAIAAEVPETFDARTRAYLLLKCHGQKICKRSKPRCESCPVKLRCAYFGNRPAKPGPIS
jgi:endonuclease III